MHFVLIAAGLFGLEAAAFPTVINDIATRTRLEAFQKRQSEVTPGSAAAIAASKARGNCGVVPCLVFDAKEQFVSTTGANAFVVPKKTDIRGPCPGLNAAANHGYLNHNGITTTTQTAAGLAAAYGLDPVLGAALAVIAIGTDGDPVAGTWSIGGPVPVDAALKGVLGQGLGISYSHNTYENDASIGRADYYTNNGDAHSLQIPRFLSAYHATSAPDRYTLDSFAYQYWQNVKLTIASNPYAFWAPFGGLVAPAAYNFVINFMSNHSAAEPSGYLDGSLFKTFFAVSGDSPANFKWNRGLERIPHNWYRRTSSNQYSLESVVEDLGVQFLAYPDSFRFGGNLGKVNTYEGFDLGDLTGGVYTNAGLLENPETFTCFAMEFIKAGTPDAVSKLLNGLSALDTALTPFNCPAITKLDPTTLDQFPGYKGASTNGFQKPQDLPYKN